MNYIYAYQLVIGLLCLTIKISAQENKHQEQTRKVRITVFVHGIKNVQVQPHLSLSNINRLFNDDIEDSLYAQSVSYIRKDPFFFQDQAMQEIGWHAIDIDRVQPGYASGLLASLYDEVEKLSPNYQAYENYYYTYGWQGILSMRARYFDALPLYHHIAETIAQFKAQGIEPHVRLIGYSHGGNVSLNLAAVRQQEPVNQHMRINELILIGVPIQCETDFFINDPLFEKIYQISSHGDLIQGLDFLSTKRFLSRKQFKARSCFKLPDNLTQIELRLTKTTAHKRPGHCVCQDKASDTRVRTHHTYRLRDISPGHIELWYFGWTPAHYRAHFPLCPLPVVTFLPYILAQLATITHQTNDKPNKKIVLDIRPEHEQMMVWHYEQGCKKLTQLPFVANSNLQQLQAMTIPYRPYNYTKESYDAQVEKAVCKARKDRYETMLNKTGRSKRSSR